VHGYLSSLDITLLLLVSLIFHLTCPFFIAPRFPSLTSFSLTSLFLLSLISNSLVLLSLSANSSQLVSIQAFTFLLSTSYRRPHFIHLCFTHSHFTYSHFTAKFPTPTSVDLTSAHPTSDPPSLHPDLTHPLFKIMGIQHIPSYTYSNEMKSTTRTHRLSVSYLKNEKNRPRTHDTLPSIIF